LHFDPALSAPISPAAAAAIAQQLAAELKARITQVGSSRSEPAGAMAAAFAKLRR